MRPNFVFNNGEPKILFQETPLDNNNSNDRRRHCMKHNLLYMNTGQYTVVLIFFVMIKLIFFLQSALFHVVCTPAN